MTYALCPAVDLGVLPVALHDDLTAMIEACDHRYLGTIPTVMKHAGLNLQGEMEGDDTIILGPPQDAHRNVLGCVYDHIASSFKMELGRDEWLDNCEQDGQFLATFAVGIHDDAGMGDQRDRLLLTLRTPGYYQFIAFDEDEVEQFEKTLVRGQIVLFDEELKHQLVMIGAKSAICSGLLEDEETGHLPESQLAYFLNLPSPIQNDA